jgi:hypothetical protein
LKMPIDADFFRIADESTKTIFLATDTIETQRKSKNRYGSRCILNSTLNESNSHNRRQSRLTDACVYMLVCVYATEFHGTIR